MSEQPESVFGRWILAQMLNRPDEAAKYAAELQTILAADPEQFIVANVLFRSLVTKVFAPDQDVREIAGFVDAVFTGITHPNGVLRVDAEAFIRDALGETDVILDGLGLAQRLSVQLPFSAALIRRLGASPDDVAALTAQSERAARALGVELTPAD